MTGDARELREPRSTRAAERVWVLDDPRAGTSAQAIGIAERLGVPFRRIPLSWNWMAHPAALARRGSLRGLAVPARGDDAQAMPWSVQSTIVAARSAAPRLVISAGSRSAAVGLWLKARFGCRLVHCMRPGLAGVMRTRAFDLLVIPEHDRPRKGDNMVPVLGAPHRLSPLLLRQAAVAWEERLDHLPRPRVMLAVGGGLSPAAAHTLGRDVARMAIERGGAVLATTSRRTGAEATEALGAGLGRALHLLYRWGEPGENPYRGFLAVADAVVVTADSVSMLSEACAGTAPVFAALPRLAGFRHRRFLSALERRGHVRPLGEDLSPWPHTPLDEAGRVAQEIIRRFPQELSGAE